MLSGALVAAVAGCSGGSSSDSDDSQYGSGGETTGTATATETATATSTESTTRTEESEPELDLREANVVAVALEGDGGSYTFDVTLHHDDDGEDGYANWWQVERLDGTRLGRRELLHPHSQQPFTRSATIEISDGVSCVAVRGHDEIHGYGGRMMVANLGSGETRAIEQGADPRAVDESDCP